MLVRKESRKISVTTCNYHWCIRYLSCILLPDIDRSYTFWLNNHIILYRMNTLQGTNISPKNGILKMMFLFPRWDMLIPWRVLAGSSHSIFLFHCHQTASQPRKNSPVATPKGLSGLAKKERKPVVLSCFTWSTKQVRSGKKGKTLGISWCLMLDFWWNANAIECIDFVWNKNQMDGHHHKHHPIQLAPKMSNISGKYLLTGIDCSELLNLFKVDSGDPPIMGSPYGKLLIPFPYL